MSSSFGASKITHSNITDPDLFADAGMEMTQIVPTTNPTSHTPQPALSKALVLALILIQLDFLR